MADIEFDSKTYENYLLLTLTGKYSKDNYKDAIEKVSEHANKNNITKVIIDLQNVKGDLLLMDRYELGLEFANTIKNDLKVAVIDIKSRITKFAETVAKNRATNLKVFDNLQDGIDWIK